MIRLAGREGEREGGAADLASEVIIINAVRVFNNTYLNKMGVKM